MKNKKYIRVEELSAFGDDAKEFIGNKLNAFFKKIIKTGYDDLNINLYFQIVGCHVNKCIYLDGDGTTELFEYKLPSETKIPYVVKFIDAVLSKMDGKWVEYLYNEDIQEILSNTKEIQTYLENR